jgi:hypothetical protein
MATKVYGCSDDLIEFEGDVHGEVGCFGTDDRERGALLMFSDATVLEAKYGKNGEAIWELKLHHQGALLIGIDQCADPEADPYSDVARFRDGLAWVYAAKGDWEKVR